MELLHGSIRDYAWGSRSALAELQGRPAPTDGPEAELWLGAHPGSPATVDRDGERVSLTDLLLAEPDHWLGEQQVGRFGTRLPFLLKVLAAEAPLSLQAHPDAEQARAGYAAEQAGVEQAGVQPAGAGRAGDGWVDGMAGPGQGPRNYVDPYHKPELLVALTPFDALCGFRDPQLSATALAGFGVPELSPVVAALRAGPAGLREAVRVLLTWPDAERAGLIGAVRSAEAAGPDAELARDLATRYPADPGVLVALLLHHVRLTPGEAIWMPAGNLHAYLSGTGVEIMAASDNVLRGGLTPKHVDVDELLRVLRFEVLDDPVLVARPVTPGVVCWPVPVDDFALHRVTVDAAGPEVRLARPGPRVVFCHQGKVGVDDGEGAVMLGPGQAAVGTAAGAALVLSGTGTAFVATCGG
ncbi:putative mannose-6-phosphate isomerase ManA [Micromonospora humidisoli]|uniref:mannose-6-phosphate isomerase, class I n=1 Tax=Micromonospora sp. AKA109 TaxID=2733865 RepID=UPI0022C3C046|nr:mannose-6-phosphate isomerase, class I [Micromonospora sp. AKA109]GHJ10036.1 putative mannose-6-phosphate isomerase ManA [Micromonospora sp. AKA109]